MTFKIGESILKERSEAVTWMIQGEETTMTTTVAPPAAETVADLHARLGGVPLSRIRSHPAPGTATEADVLIRPNGEKRFFELVDGMLVEKPMGYYESLLASILIRLLGFFLEQHDLGFVLGEGGMMRLAPGLVRIPDVSFVSWDHFPNRELPAGPVPDMVPDLAVEVISEGNTEDEMKRKLDEYFSAGARLVWYVYPPERSVHVYQSPMEARVLSQDDVLDGGAVLPGFQMAIRELFDRAGHRQGHS